MTNTKQKNVQTALDTTPSNTNKTKQSQLKNLINLASKTDKERNALNITTESVCNDIVKYYKALDINAFNVKFQSDAIKNDFNIRVKGHKNSKTSTPISGTAKTVISNTKKYIKNIGIIQNQTYGEIRKALNNLNAITVSEKRKAYNKQLALLSDNDIKQLLALFSEMQK